MSANSRNQHDDLNAIANLIAKAHYLAYDLERSTIPNKKLQQKDKIALQNLKLFLARANQEANALEVE